MNKPSYKLSPIALSVFHDPDGAMIRKVDATLVAHNEKALQTPERTCAITAEIDGEHAGGVFFWFYIPHAIIHFVSVEEKWRRHGIGRQLLNKTEGELARAGCNQIIVDTMPFQAPEFYRAMQYELITTTPCYFGGADRLTFRKYIQGSGHE